MQKLRGGGTLPSKASYIQLLKSFTGGSASILILLMITKLSGVSLLMAPFGATCVLLFAVPSSPLAQPRNVIGGHFLSALIGVIVLYTIGDSMVSIAIAVGLAISCMQFFRIIHPPAGANPIVVLLAGKQVIGVSFLFTPVLAGSILLVLIAAVINNLGRNTHWPIYWFGKNE